MSRGCYIICQRMIDASNLPACNGACPDLDVDERFNATVQEYVEVIRDLIEAGPVARVKDIAERRGVTRSSVSIALKDLRSLGLVQHEHYGYVELTDDGRELGAVLSRRHAVIRTFLENILGLPAEAANNEACRLEHAMSPETLDALVEYVRRLEGCPWCSFAPVKAMPG
ncbi:MAG: metal-dependent transcriptional regulator [Calditrichaeota bacterium]|nr:metal-dependent transcriptional regulator [Calditrichota bacterium]